MIFGPYMEMVPFLYWRRTIIPDQIPVDPVRTVLDIASFCTKLDDQTTR